MRQAIVVLEDNLERQVAMRARLRDRMPGYRLCFFRDPRNLNVWLLRHRKRVLAMALDHDLTELPNSMDLTGMDTVSLLECMRPRFPVLVHSSNEDAAPRMVRRLGDAGWKVGRVSPMGDLSWIDDRWFPEMRRLILESAGRKIKPTPRPIPA